MGCNMELCQAVKRPCILCVDDSNFVRNSICSILISKGWDCENSAGGNEALQWFISCPEQIDILITDHQMPEMTGLELVKKVRATAFPGKILVHSSMLQGREVAAYKELKMDAIVPKTGNPQPLLKMIEAFLQDKSFETDKETYEM